MRTGLLRTAARSRWRTRTCAASTVGYRSLAPTPTVIGRAAPATPVASATIVRASLHAHRAPCESPSAARPTPGARSAVPIRSGSRERLRSERGAAPASPASARPSGTLIMNGERQPSASTNTPPTLGPTAGANAPAAPAWADRGSERAGGAPHPDRRRPLLRRRVAEHDRQRCRDHRLRRSPWRARATSSTGTLGAAAHSADSSAKPPTPARKTVRLPITSASRPDGPK
jgi:hypothetical protein